MTDALQMRVLGLPAWAWGAILGLGVVGVSYWRHAHGGGADPNSGGTDPNAATDANGNPIDTSGVASYNGTMDDSAMDSGGYFPGPIGGVGGFNYASPAPAPNPNSRLDPKTERELRALIREERAEHKHKRNRKGTKRVPNRTPHNPTPVR